MRSLTKLGFIGSYKADMLLFIARSLALLDLKVIVVDCDPNGYLSDYLPEVVDKKVMHGKHVDYYLGPLPSYFEGLYDIALCDFGTSEAYASDYIACQWHFMITDPQKHHINRLRTFLQRISERQERVQLIKIYRDMITGKINEQYLDFTLSVHEVFEVIASYVFEHHIEDYKYRIHSTYNEQIMFSALPKTYWMFYQDLIEELLDMDKKLIRDAVNCTRKEVMMP